jgi:hypothetical protein
LRKYFIRNLPADEKGKPHWFTRAALWWRLIHHTSNIPL